MLLIAGALLRHVPPRPDPRRMTVVRPTLFLVLAASAACAGGSRATPTTPTTPATTAAPAASAAAPRPLTPAELVNRDGGIPPYVQADVDFMTGMIGHHSQAVVMARMAPTHEASAAVRGLAARIAVAQQDEIALMQR
jgi:hypothetical protein